MNIIGISYILPSSASLTNSPDIAKNARYGSSVFFQEVLSFHCYQLLEDNSIVGISTTSCSQIFLFYVKQQVTHVAYLTLTRCQSAIGVN